MCTGLGLADVLHFALREEEGLEHMPPNNFSATGIPSDSIFGACMDIPSWKIKVEVLRMCNSFKQQNDKLWNLKEIGWWGWSGNSSSQLQTDMFVYILVANGVPVNWTYTTASL